MRAVRNAVAVFAFVCGFAIAVVLTSELIVATIAGLALAVTVLGVPSEEEEQ